MDSYDPRMDEPPPIPVEEPELISPPSPAPPSFPVTPPPPPPPFVGEGTSGDNTNAIGLVGFVFSILSAVTCPVPFFGWGCWLVGFVCSCIGLARRPKTFALAGLIICLVSAMLMISFVLLLFVDDPVSSLK